MRGLAYKRFQRKKHIKRKENILRACRPDNPPHQYNDSDLFGFIKKQNVFSNEGNWFPFHIVSNRGKLNKGKIHCSCSLCSAKMRNKGKRRRLYGNYAPNINYKINDLRQIQQMNWDEFHWYEENIL